MPPKSVQITLKLRLPKDFCGGASDCDVVFTNKAFDMTWLKFLESYKPEVYQVIVSSSSEGKRYAIKDQRPNRIVWELNCTIKSYIDGFERKLKKYIANIVPYPDPTRVHVINPSSAEAEGIPETPKSSARPRHLGRNRAIHAASGSKRPGENCTNQDSSPNKRHRSNQEEVLMNVGGGENLPGPSSSFGAVPTALNMNGGQYNEPRRIFDHLMDDDAASMAETVDSQESLDDLEEAGINVNNTKAKTIFMANVGKYISNVDVLRMRMEMVKGKNDRRWVRLNRWFPTIAYSLQETLWNGF